MYAAHHLAHPALVAVDDAGRGVQQVILGEQPLHVLNAVGDKCVLHAAAALAVRNGGIDLVHAVAQHALLRVVVENVVLHVVLLVFVVLIVIIVVLVVVLIVLIGVILLVKAVLRHAHQCTAALLLFGGHAVVHFFQRLTACVCHIVILLVQRVVVGVQPVLQADTAIGIDKGLAAFTIVVCAMRHDLVDQCPGVATGQYQAQLPDHTVHHRLSGLLQTVCKNGHGINVAAAHRLQCRLAAGGVVQLDVCIYAILPVLQQSVPQYILRAGVVVVPHHRHLLAVVALKGVRRNGQPVVALRVRLGRITGKIVVKIQRHFDFSFH